MPEARDSVKGGGATVQEQFSRFQEAEAAGGAGLAVAVAEQGEAVCGIFGEHTVIEANRRFGLGAPERAMLHLGIAFVGTVEAAEKAKMWIPLVGNCGETPLDRG
jgi:hypothetical protein